MSQFYTPTDEELNKAVEEQNSLLLSRYALAFENLRRGLHEQVPDLLAAASNAKRDLDKCKAAIKSADSSINLIQSVLRQMRP